MTNLLNLPQIPAGTSITISSNADFNKLFSVGIPNFASSPITVVGTIDGTTAVISGIASTAGIAPGMGVNGFGIRPGSVVAPGGVGSGTLTLNNTTTAAVAGLQITISPPPLDLTGISFNSMLRESVTSATVLIQMSTLNGLMVNGNQVGTYGWAVPAAKLPAWPGLSSTGQLSLVLDVQATDATGAIVDLCTQNGPIPVTVMLSVVR